MITARRVRLSERTGVTMHSAQCAVNVVVPQPQRSIICCLWRARCHHNWLVSPVNALTSSLRDTRLPGRNICWSVSAGGQTRSIGSCLVDPQGDGDSSTGWALKPLT
jgi:hypothetical protein